MRVLHAYKVYLPDAYGGIPHVIAMLARLPRAKFESFVLVARAFGLRRCVSIGGAAVEL